MRVFAIGIKLADDAPVQCPHDADARMHQGIPPFGGIDQDSDRGLPRLELAFRLRQLLDIPPAY
jgi:hypothetical protein